MAPWESHPKPAKEQDQDLTSLLTTEQRGELTLLIANITECMHKNLVDTFDASYTTPNLKPAKNLSPYKDNPNLDPAKNPSIEKLDDRAEESKEELEEKEKEEAEKLHKLQEKREKELSAPKLQELKQDAEEFFAQWQESVISRVGEIMNSKEEAKEQQEHASAEETPEGPDINERMISKYKDS